MCISGGLSHLSDQLPAIVSLLDELYYISHTRGNVLDTLPNLFEESVNVSNFRQCVVDGKVDLALILQGGILFRRCHGGSITGDGALDLGLTCGNYTSIEINLSYHRVRICMHVCKL